MREDIIKRLSGVTESEMSVMAEGYTVSSHAAPAFDNMKLRRRDYVYHVMDSERGITAHPHTRFVELPFHSHNYIEMMCVLKGEIVHIIDGETHVLREGQIMFMNRHLLHAIRASRAEDLAMNFIISRDDWTLAASRLQNDPSLRDFSEQERDEHGESRFLIYDISAHPYAQSLLENLLCQTVFEKDTPKDILRDTLFLLLRNLEATPACLVYSLSAGRERDPMHARISAYIQASYRTASLMELAALLGMSAPYVSRRVKKLFGTSFTALVRERRFSEAEQLLLHSDIPVTEIAEAIGYENNSFFHRCFYEQYGISPSKWRKMRQ